MWTHIQDTGIKLVSLKLGNEIFDFTLFNVIQWAHVYIKQGNSKHFKQRAYE